MLTEHNNGPRNRLESAVQSWTRVSPFALSFPLKTPLIPPFMNSKFKISRGGGRHFSRDIAVVDQEMENLGLGGSDDESESDEEESDDEQGAGSKEEQPEMSRAERKAMKKAQAGKKAGAQGGGRGLPPQSDEEEESEEEEVDPMLQSGPLARQGPSRRER